MAAIMHDGMPACDIIMCCRRSEGRWQDVDVEPPIVRLSAGTSSSSSSSCVEDDVASTPPESAAITRRGRQRQECHTYYVRAAAPSRSSPSCFADDVVVTDTRRCRPPTIIIIRCTLYHSRVQLINRSIFYYLFYYERISIIPTNS